jgi:hypothetical protein
MKSTLRWAPFAGAVLLSACTYGIVLDPGGQSVRVAWNGNTGIRPCRDVGKVTVSVLSRIGPVDRNDIKVRDELEIMARNQAAQMHADTITPLGEPRDGEQSWEAWQCGTVVPATPSSRPSSGAPVEDVPAYGPPPSAYPPPPANTPQPTPFGAPVPAGGAQTYPLSGSTS